MKVDAPKIVHASKVVNALKNVEKEDTDGVGAQNNLKVRNAFKILMDSGGGAKKTPGKAMKRLGKVSARKTKIGKELKS